MPTQDTSKVIVLVGTHKGGLIFTSDSQVPTFTRPSKSGRPTGTPEEARDETASKSSHGKVNKVWDITLSETPSLTFCMPA